MTSHFLLSHRNTRLQYGKRRRGGNRPSGVVVVHTAENITDLIGPDTGAEAVAAFIARRPNPGSYHALCDADSTIPMVPWSYETWNDTRTNPHNVGISAAIRSADWPRLGDRGDAIVMRMAGAARDFADWLLDERGIVVPPRWISRDQALNRVPGFIGHGDIDTGRRTDPGRHFNRDLFLEAFADSPAVLTPATPKPALTADPFSEDTMDYDRLILALYREIIGRAPADTEVDWWVVQAATFAWTPATLVTKFRTARPEAVTVADAYRDELGRDATPAEVTDWLKRAAAKAETNTVSWLRASIHESQEAVNYRARRAA